MPLYPYECSSCGHAFSELQGGEEEHLLTCPACGEDKLVRVFGIPNAICRSKPKTIGQLAAENTRQLVMKEGKERAMEIIHEKTYGKGGKKLKLPKGAKRQVEKANDTVEIPWWRTGEVQGTGPRSETPVDVSAVSNAEKYIMTGDKS